MERAELKEGEEERLLERRNLLRNGERFSARQWREPTIA